MTGIQFITDDKGAGSCVASYRVEIRPSARKRIGAAARQADRLYCWAVGVSGFQSAAACKKLKGGDREWRIRVGDYRVVYATRIRHRSEVQEP